MSNFSLDDTEQLNERLHHCLQSIKVNNQCNSDIVKSLLNDLQMHQIELEMKNRELLASQADLEKARDKYANLYDFSPTGYVSFDTKGCIQEINLTACQLLGYERLTALEKPFSLFLPLNDINIFFKHIKEAGSTSAKTKTRLSIKSRNGKIHQVELESICHANEDNSISIQSALIDVTDRVAAEHAKSENDRQLHSIINALPVLVAHIDCDNQYIFTNKTHDNIFPLADQHYAGKSLVDVMGEQAYSNLLPHIQSALNGHQVICEIDIQVLGKKTAFRISLLPRVATNNAIGSYFMVMTDISVYKQKEVDVMTHLTSLAHEARIHLIGQMTTEIAHEINQPLAAIANYAIAGLRMQRAGKLHAHETEEIFHEIDGQVHRASQIISHLKKFSKNNELQHSKTNINDLIENVLKLMVAEEHWHGIETKSVLDDTLPCLYIDGILIEQVLINLLRNAIEAMAEANQKNPFILLKTARVENDVVISIADNGPGMSYEMLDTIFTPFFSTKESGVGLGLSICKSIIESHNGTLWATHNSQKGTTLYIQLPIAEP